MAEYDKQNVTYTRKKMNVSFFKIFNPAYSYFVKNISTLRQWLNGLKQGLHLEYVRKRGYCVCNE